MPIAAVVTVALALAAVAVRGGGVQSLSLPLPLPMFNDAQPINTPDGILASFSALFGVVMFLTAPPTDKAIYFYAFGGLSSGSNIRSAAVPVDTLRRSVFRPLGRQRRADLARSAATFR
jgi:hypothetical protein